MKRSNIVRGCMFIWACNRYGKSDAKKAKLGFDTPENLLHALVLQGLNLKEYKQLNK